jgi:hypothetical protein
MAHFRAIPVFSMTIGMLVDDFGKAVSICWPWMAIILATTGIILVMQPELAPVFSGSGAAYDQLPGTAWIALGLFYTVWFVAFCSMAVNWHRFLLRDDVPEGWEHLRLDGKVWRYAGNTLLLSLVTGLLYAVFLIMIAGFVTAAVGAVAAGTTEGGGLAVALIILCTFAFSLFAITFMFRLSIKLPAIAVGDDYGLGDAWRDSRGNNIRLFGFMLLLMIPVLFMGLGQLFVHLALEFFMGAESLLKTVVTVLVWVAVTWVNMMFTFTGMALLYAVFANGAEID